MAETLNQYKSNLNPEEVDQALHNIAQLDDGIAQAKQYAEQAQGYAESINPGNFYTKAQADSAFAPKSHASTLATYGTGSSAVYGHVKLSDTPGTSGVSDGTAATPKCVQDAVQAATEYQPGDTLSISPQIIAAGLVTGGGQQFLCAVPLSKAVSSAVSSAIVTGGTMVARGINGYIIGGSGDYKDIASLASSVTIAGTELFFTFVSDSGYGVTNNTPAVASMYNLVVQFN